MVVVVFGLFFGDFCCPKQLAARGLGFLIDLQRTYAFSQRCVTDALLSPTRHKPCVLTGGTFGFLSSPPAAV